MTSASTRLQDLKDRGSTLRIEANLDFATKLLSRRLGGANDLRDSDLRGSDASPKLLQFCKDLAHTVSQASASAKLAAQPLNATVLGGPALDSAIQQLEKEVCGPTNQNLSRCEVLERLVAHAQAMRLRSTAKTEASQAAPVVLSPEEEASCALRSLAELVSAETRRTAPDQLEAVRKQLDALVKSLPGYAFDSLVQEAGLTAAQRRQVEEVFAAMEQEYTVRRRMLIERTKVTLQSMLWSKEFLESRGTTEQACAAAEAGQSRLNEQPNIRLSDVYVARIGDALAVTCKGASDRADSFEASVKSIVIGKVPDRGGRPAEGREAAALAAMPDWAPRAGRGGSSSRGGPRGGDSGRGRQSDSSEKSRGSHNRSSGSGGRAPQDAYQSTEQSGTFDPRAMRAASASGYLRSHPVGRQIDPNYGHQFYHSGQLASPPGTGYSSGYAPSIGHHYGQPQLATTLLMPPNMAGLNAACAAPGYAAAGYDAARHAGGRGIGPARSDGAQQGGNRGSTRVQGGWRRGGGGRGRGSRHEMGA